MPLLTPIPRLECFKLPFLLSCPIHSSNSHPILLKKSSLPVPFLCVFTFFFKPPRAYLYKNGKEVSLHILPYLISSGYQGYCVEEILKWGFLHAYRAKEVWLAMSAMGISDGPNVCHLCFTPSSWQFYTSSLVL